MSPLFANKLSIIIPTRNESQSLPDTIRSIKLQTESKLPIEILVVDTGSSDGTQSLATSLGARVLECSHLPCGRAFALNEGVRAASGDLLMFLDADCLVPKGYDESILMTLADERVVGGAFEFTLDGPQFGLRIVELVNRIRYRIWPRYFGDQGIFVRRKDYEAVKGYPDMRIMEASNFCLALGRIGKLVLVKKPMKTSPRRFLENGIYRMLFQDTRIWFMDLIGESTDRFASAYWSERVLSR